MLRKGAGPRNQKPVPVAVAPITINQLLVSCRTQHSVQLVVTTRRKDPHMLLGSPGICQWSSPTAVRPDSTVRTSPAWWAPRSQERDRTTPGPGGAKVTWGTHTVRRSWEDSEFYRIDSKQGQRGIQKAQTCTERECHVTEQDYFRLHEESKEGILRGFSFCSGQSKTADGKEADKTCEYKQARAETFSHYRWPARRIYWKEPWPRGNIPEA